MTRHRERISFTHNTADIGGQGLGVRLWVISFACGGVDGHAIGFTCAQPRAPKAGNGNENTAPLPAKPVSSPARKRFLQASQVTGPLSGRRPTAGTYQRFHAQPVSESA